MGLCCDFKNILAKEIGEKWGFTQITDISAGKN
jgi:hypothetical protein